jgi:hypothetical protein
MWPSNKKHDKIECFCDYFYFYRITTYFNSLKIMSLNCNAKKEEEKKKNTIRNKLKKYVQSREWI